MQHLKRCMSFFKALLDVVYYAFRTVTWTIVNRSDRVALKGQKGVQELCAESLHIRFEMCQDCIQVSTSHIAKTAPHSATQMWSGQHLTPYDILLPLKPKSQSLLYYLLFITPFYTGSTLFWTHLSTIASSARTRPQKQLHKHSWITKTILFSEKVNQLPLQLSL